MADDDRIDVVQLREALGWTQQQLADHCDTDRSTVSKWEKEPPTKGPALILLRQLRAGLDGQADDAPQDAPAVAPRSSGDRVCPAAPEPAAYPAGSGAVSSTDDRCAIAVGEAAE